MGPLTSVLEAPAGFQYNEVTSFAVAINAPPIPMALGPTPMFKNGAAVEPTLVCATKIEPDIKKNNINFFMFSTLFNKRKLANFRTGIRSFGHENIHSK